MWLATKHGFLSAVATPQGGIVVRSRERQALASLKPHLGRKPKVVETPTGRDYRYRTFLTREEFGRVVQGLAADIDYGNFKDAVLAEAKAGRVSMKYERALHRVWSIFGETQPGGPYGWRAPRRRVGKRRRRGADSVLFDDLGVRELDLGEYGTWPDDLSIEDELAALDADPLDPRFEAEVGR